MAKSKINKSINTPNDVSFNHFEDTLSTNIVSPEPSEFTKLNQSVDYTNQKSTDMNAKLNFNRYIFKKATDLNLPRLENNQRIKTFQTVLNSVDTSMDTSKSPSKANILNSLTQDSKPRLVSKVSIDRRTLGVVHKKLNKSIFIQPSDVSSSRKVAPHEVTSRN